MKKYFVLFLILTVILFSFSAQKAEARCCKKFFNKINNIVNKIVLLIPIVVDKTIQCFILGQSVWSGCSSPPPPPPPAPTVSISANPSTIKLGDNSNLVWVSTNANAIVSCNIDHGIGGVKPSDSKIISPLITTTYNITCFFGNIGIASNSAIITVIPPPTVNLSTKTQYEIFKPTDTANVGLSWNSTYADSCVASGDWSGSKNIGNPNAVSEYLPKLRGDYSFTLGCSGAGGSVEKTATTKVIQIPQCNFSADKSSIVLPDTATLSWSCDYVSEGSGSGGGCSINQNIGSVGSSGSKEIRPSKTTSYLLTCNGLDGSNSFETTVNINTPLKIKYQEVIPR